MLHRIPRQLLACLNIFWKLKDHYCYELFGLQPVLIAQGQVKLLNSDFNGVKTLLGFFNRRFDLQDRKLGAVLTRAFDDCLVSESIFKLLHIFGSLIQRKLIAQELSARMPILVTMLNQEMDESKVIYNKQIQRSDHGVFCLS